MAVFILLKKCDFFTEKQSFWPNNIFGFWNTPVVAESSRQSTPPKIVPTQKKFLASIFLRISRFEPGYIIRIFLYITTLSVSILADIGNKDNYITRLSDQNDFL